MCESWVRPCKHACMGGEGAGEQLPLLTPSSLGGVGGMEVWKAWRCGRHGGVGGMSGEGVGHEEV